MDNTTKSPINRMAELLAEMTERAIEAERERDAAKKDAENWYRLYCDKDEKLKQAENALDASNREYEKLRGEIGGVCRGQAEGSARECLTM